MIDSTDQSIKRKQCSGRPKDAQKHLDIVNAAGALFLEQGYTLTSVEAVAKKADVSKLTIYSHFCNKADLFKEVIRQGCDRQMAPDNYMKYANRPVRSALLDIGNSFVNMIFSSDSLRLSRIMQAEAVNHPEIIPMFYEAGPQRVKASFAELLRAWIAAKVLDIPNVEKATEQYFSLLKGEAHSRALMHLTPEFKPNELDEHVKASVDLFLAGYLRKNDGASPCQK